MIEEWNVHSLLLNLI